MAAFDLLTQGGALAPKRGHARDKLRHELIEAQVYVLNAYLAKRSPDDILAALERLVTCCQASFEAEESLMARLCGQADSGHRERHQAVLQRLEQLRLSVGDTDRGQLLASLILIDRELITHVADARKIEAGDLSGTAVTVPEAEPQY